MEMVGNGHWCLFPTTVSGLRRAMQRQQLPRQGYAYRPYEYRGIHHLV